MSRPTRVALCWSGQTRNYNDPKNHQIILHSHDEVFKECEVHHYGHTWSDQPRPFDEFKFQKFKSQDQTVIEEFVTSADLQRRLLVKEDWFGYPEWKAMSPSDRVMHAFSYQKAIYGQIWSFIECLKLIDNINHYDYIVKTRWDTGYRFYDNSPVWPTNTTEDEYYQIFRNYIASLWKASQNDPVFACINILKDASIPSPLQDHIFIIKRASKIIKNLNNLSVEGIIDRYIDAASRQKNGTYEGSSHSAWEMFFDVYQARVLEILPNIFSCVDWERDYDNDRKNVWRL